MGLLGKRWFRSDTPRYEADTNTHKHTPIHTVTASYSTLLIIIIISYRACSPLELAASQVYTVDHTDLYNLIWLA